MKTVKTIREQIEALPIERLEAIIRWNENGNDTLDDESYDKSDLVETVLNYCGADYLEPNETPQDLLNYILNQA